MAFDFYNIDCVEQLWIVTVVKMLLTNPTGFDVGHAFKCTLGFYVTGFAGFYLGIRWL